MAYVSKQEIKDDKEALFKAAYEVLLNAQKRGYFQQNDNDSDEELDEKAHANFIIDDIEQHFTKEKEFEDSTK